MYYYACSEVEFQRITKLTD